MKPGDLVMWGLEHLIDTRGELGIILEEIPYEERGNDPFPHYMVLFPSRGKLHCRGRDLWMV